MAEPHLSDPAMFPVLYPASAPFLDANGAPSGARGAIARVTIEFNLRPNFLTSIRAMNVYEIGSAFEEKIPFLDKLDGFQTMTTELTQSNIVVRETLQPLAMGRDGFVWHPLPCPYNWRGGNNITLLFRRLVAYPALILPTVHVTLECLQLVNDRTGP